MKKGRHRRFEEARAMKRSQDVDFDALFDSLNTDQVDDLKPRTRGRRPSVRRRRRLDEDDDD